MNDLLESFERQCRDRGAELAIWSRGERLGLSFEDVANDVATWSAKLGALEPAIARPWVLALGVGNVAAFVPLVLAAFSLRIPIALVDGALPAEEKLALCRRLGLPGLIHRDTTLIGEELGGGLVFTRPAGVAPCPPPAGTVLVKITSGSTGDPVGICLSAAALDAGIRQIAEGMELTRQDRVLMAIPLSHSYGFDNGLLSLVKVGTPLILEPGYYPAMLLSALSEGGATFFPAVPPMVRALAESDWPRDLPLSRVISAGGPLAAEFASRFAERSGRPVRQFYGSTETGGISFERRPEEPQALGTVGQPLPGVSVSVDSQGSVQVDSAANFIAYLGQPIRDNRVVKLADRGEWTAEGRLRLTGRTADLLNVGGRRVSTAAIEASLRELPGIREAAVVGVADPLRGDRVVAFLVGAPVILEGQRLPPGLAPRDLRYLDALPFTSRGKLDRASLRRLAGESIG